MGEHHPRVTIVGLNYSPEPTGIAPYTAGLAAGLLASDWDVKVVTGFPHYPAWKISEGYVGSRMSDSVDGVPITRLRPYMPKNPSGLKRLLLEVLFGVKSSTTSWHNPEVIILVSPALFAVAIAQFRALLMVRRPLVLVWVQDLYSLGVAETGTLGGRGAKIMAGVESRVLRNADAVVVIHDRFKKFVVSRLGVQNDRVEVIRNWTHLVPVEVDRDFFRKKFGWTDEIVVLHAGNMGAKQALESVVEAARLADSENAPIRFVLLGNGNQKEALATLGAGINRLEFMQSLNDEDFQGAMAAADLLLVNEKPGVAEMAVPSKLTSYFAAAREFLLG